MLLYKVAFLLPLLLGSTKTSAFNTDEEDRLQLEMYVAAGANLLLKEHISEILQDPSKKKSLSALVLLHAAAANKMLTQHIINSQNNSSKATIHARGVMPTSLTTAMAPTATTTNTATTTATTTNNKIPLSTSCAEALPPGQPSGDYTLQLPGFDHLKPFEVYCLQDPNGGAAWTMILRRQNGHTNFYRNWEEYKSGFGNIHDEFFIGLEHLHALTAYQKQELWVQLTDQSNNMAFAKYAQFAIGDEASKYALNTLGSYIGNATDSLREQHNGKKFSTLDQNNGNRDHENCATFYKGAWWYNDDGQHCYGSHLFGPYKPDGKVHQGIYWDNWKEDTMKYVHMAIRPAK